MRKWTLIGLVRAEHGDSIEINECIRMFQTIFSLEIPQDVAIVVWLTMDADNLHRLDPDYQRPAGAPEGLNVTRFYSIENLTAPTGGVKCRLVRAGSGEDNFSLRDPEYVQQFFTEVALKADYAGTRKLLVTWGHGTPYGMYWDGEPIPGQKWNMLDTQSLASAIEGAFGDGDGPTIDLLITVNCYLQFFDSLHCLAAARVGYLVAAPNGNKFVGYNYTEILGGLFGNLDMEPGALAKMALSTLDDPGGNKATRMQQLRDVAIYANDLRLAGDMGHLINALGDALLNELPAKAGTISNALGRTATMNGFYFNADFFQLVDALAVCFGNGWQQELVGKIRAMKPDLQIASYYGRSIKKTGGFPKGFTICLPPRNGSSLDFYELYFRPESPYRSSFTGGSWARFVESFVYVPAGAASAATAGS